MNQSHTRIKSAVVMIVILAAAAIVIPGCRNDGRFAKRRANRDTVEQTNTPAASGLTTGHIQVGGVRRTYHFAMPDQRGGGGVGLVMAFHGGNGDGPKFESQTGLAAIANNRGLAVVFPDALGSNWNDGRETTRTEGDDVAFVRALIDHLASSQGIDRKRVFATGASNGGMFTQRLACEMADEIAAFVPVISSMPAAYAPNCRPSRPVPMMMINGTDDPGVKWEGGELRGGRTAGKGGVILSVPETVAFWVNNNRCAPTPTSEQVPDRDRNDGTRIEIKRYDQCAAGAPVVFVVVDGGGHAWPGSPQTVGKLRARFAGRTSHDLNASQLVCDFVESRRL